MPRKLYIPCPACLRRKGIEGTMLVEDDHAVPVVHCLACRADSIGPTVVRTREPGRTNVPEVRRVLADAMRCEAVRLRERATNMRRDADEMDTLARRYDEESSDSEAVDQT